MRRKRPGRRRSARLDGQPPGERHDRDAMEEAASQHRDAGRRVEPGHIGVEAAERRTVVGCRGGIGVEDSREAMRTAVSKAVERKFGDRRDRAEAENEACLSG